MIFDSGYVTTDVQPLSSITVSQKKKGHLLGHVIAHSRTSAVEDYPEPSRKRYLLGLWLANANGRPIPPAYSTRYKDLKPGQRPAGGIITPETVLHAPLEPE